jgi:superfamily I DNA/RNA helicase
VHKLILLINSKNEFGKDEDEKDLYKQYELLCNFRSKKNIVEYSNDFITKLKKDIKLCLYMQIVLIMDM